MKRYIITNKIEKYLLMIAVAYLMAWVMVIGDYYHDVFMDWICWWYLTHLVF